MKKYKQRCFQYSHLGAEYCIIKKGLVLDVVDICATKAKFGREMKQQYKITFSNFNNSSDVKPKEVTETLSKFITRFKYPEERTFTLKEFHKLSNVNQNKEKNGACYCFAAFGDDSGKEKYRNKSNVSSISGIAIDVDNKDTNEHLTIEDVDKKLKDYFFIIHSTHSSTKEQPRFRVVIPFAKPIVPEKHADVFDYFYQLCDKKIDANTKDVSRLFYYPSCPKGETKNYYCFVNDGKLFDTRIVPASEPVAPKAKKLKKVAPLDCPTLKEIDLDSLTISKALKDSIIEGYKKGKFKSKSEHAYDCIMQLLQQDIKPKTIFCIIANKNYAVNAHYTSDDQVWADIVRIEKKLEEGEKGFAVVVGTEPRYPPIPKYQDPDKICNDIKNDIDTYLNKQKQNCTYSLGIKAPAGIGKTEVVIKKIVELVKERAYIEVYLPSNKLAKEFEKRILKTDHTVSVQLIHGRYSKNAPNNHCIKSKLARCLASSNVSVPSLLCINEGTRCENYDICNYRGQYTSNKSVVIYNHKHLFIKRNIEEKSRKPNLIIIDESFFEQSLNATEIKVDEIDALKVSDTVKEALATKSPYDYFKVNCDNPKKTIQYELKKLKSKRDALIDTITPSASEQESKTISASVGKFSKSITLLETIKADYIRMKGGKIPLFLYCQEKDDRDSDEKKMVAWHCIKPHSKFERLRWKEEDVEKESLIPTVYIDADLDKTITSLFFEDLDIKSYVAKRKARVWQLLSNTHAKRDFYGDAADIKIELVQKKINYFCKQFQNEGAKNVLLVTYKSLLDDMLFNFPKNCSTLHFGGLKGLDNYKDCDACMVIGRQQLPYDAIDRIAIGLWCDSEGRLPLQQKKLPTKEVKGYRIKNGKKLGIPVYVYEDDRLQAIMEQKRECETLQALDRLRLIFNDDKKAILILSNVPLDIELDQYVFYKHATNTINRLIKTSENGVISLNSKTLYHSTLYYDKELQNERSKYFESEGSAKKIISRWKKLYFNEDKEAVVYGVIMQQTKYSFDNKSGSPSYCLHKKSATDQEIITALKRIHNTDTVTLKN